MRATPISLGQLAVIAAAAPAAAASWDRIDMAPLPPLSDCPDGFLKAKGSDACVRLGGRLRVEAGVASGTTSRLTHVTTTGTGTLGSVSVDVRAPTELGPVRAYVRVQSATGISGR